MNKVVPEGARNAAIYRLFFLLTILQGLFAILALLSIPGDAKEAIVGNLSGERLLLLSLPVLLVGVGGYLLVKSLRDGRWLQALDQRLRHWLSTNARWKRVIFVGVLTIFAGSLYALVLSRGSFYILAPPEIADPSFNAYFVNQSFARLQPYLVRIQPLVMLLAGICAQTIILLPLALFGLKSWHQQLVEGNFYLVLSLYGTLLILWWAMGGTRLKLNPDYTFSGWYTLGTPILDTQVLLVFAIGLVLAVASLLLARLGQPKPRTGPPAKSTARLDLVIALMIWILAALYWLSIPTQPNWFVSAPRYPNYQYYPNSDAYLYDTTAHSLLTGSGFKTGALDFTLRPMYGFFLAGLHRLVGQDYDALTRVQSAIFALFPALIFLITRELHNRLSALIAALLVALREGNAIMLAGQITISNSRMIMSEMPVAIGVALFIWLVLLWLRNPGRRLVIAFIAGGVLGVMIQIRVEMGFLLPVFFLLAGMALFRLPKQWLKNSLLISLGLFLLLVPWVWRNWRVTGLVYLERPYERLGKVIIRAGLSTSLGPVADTIAPGATAIGAHARQTYLTSVRAHYANSQLQAFLIFPDAFRPLDSTIGYLEQGKPARFWKACCSREDYLDRFSFWRWRAWDGAIPAQSAVPVMANLFLIVAGFVTLGRRKRLRGIVPLLVTIGFYLVSSAVRVSGGRFVQTIDWIWIVYFSAGLEIMIEWIVSSFREGRLSGWMFDGVPAAVTPLDSAPLKNQLPLPAYLGIGLAILLLGTSLPLVESVIPSRYTGQTQQAWLQELLQSSQLRQASPTALIALEHIQSNQFLVLQGRALYPRYYASGEGEPGTAVTPFTPRDFARLSFYLVGPQNIGVTLPLLQQSAIEFPDATDVLVIGCPENKYLRALVVYYKTPETVLVSTPYPALPACPPQSTP